MSTASIRDPHLLAVDLGTSGPKVALITPHGRVVCSAFEPVGLRLETGGLAEQSIAAMVLMRAPGVDWPRAGTGSGS